MNQMDTLKEIGKKLMFPSATPIFYIEKINHKKSGNVSFLLHTIREGDRKKWEKTHSNYREVSKEVFERLQSEPILPETLFNNLSASFPDMKSDPLGIVSEVCTIRNAIHQSLDRADSTDLTS